MPIDFEILDYIRNNLTSSWGDVVFPFITNLGSGGILWIILTIILLVKKDTRRVGIIMAVALIIDLILCNIVLKPLVARIRPFNARDGIYLIIKKPLDYSFPSGHTAACFACVTSLFLARKKILWKIFLVPACLIAFSRLYLYVHYPTDVLGGLIVGILCGIIAYNIVKVIEKRINNKTK